MRIVYWFFLGLYSYATSGLLSSEWLDGLVSYIKKDDVEYQVLLLYDGLNGNNGSHTVERIVQGISRKVPTLKVSFQEATTEKARELSQSTSLYNPRTTMIVIIHLSKVYGNTSQLNQTLNFVKQVSVVRRRPRCLIILPQEEKRFVYLVILKRMWSNQFLDVTILELDKLKGKKKDYVSNFGQEIATLHQFDPFSKMYDRINFTKTARWFPEKTRNLRGLTMKVGVMNYPPFAFIERNGTGHASKILGLEIRLTKAVSKSMNFKVDWVASVRDPWGVGTCNKSNDSSLLYGLMNNKIQYFSLRIPRYSPCEESLHEWSVSTTILSNAIVVPIFAKKSVLVFNKWKIMNAFVLIGVFLSTWLLTRMLPFQKRNWKFLQIVRIVLGTATPNEPREVAERIVFGAMLFSCLIHSSVIYTAVTDISLRIETEPELQTINDVLHSNLEPVVAKAYYPAMVSESIGIERMLLEKATKANNLSQVCLGRLLKEKNLACLGRTDVAKWMIENNKDSCGRPRLKILQHRIQTASSGIVMEARSPYVERFDKVFLRLVQSGVTKKWQREEFNQSSLIVDNDGECAEREAESAQIERQLIYLLVFGYACATISFVCEVIFAYFTKKVN